MKFDPIGKICTGQDGAIWGPFLFRFQSDGWCCVYEWAQLTGAGGELAEIFARFRLDKCLLLLPHSNAVFFGQEYALEGDEFPILYTNIYNSYAKEADRKEGTCCAYRLWREGGEFHSQLLQVIRIGFTKDMDLWCSADGRDVRPYGNFAADRANGICYAFTMRDTERTTRYFAFRLPKLSDGEIDKNIGVPVVTLRPEDVLDWFDCPYHHYVQGACVHDGYIYSLEGFTDDAENPPLLRIIDPRERRETAEIPLAAHGLTVEPEMIDFSAERCIYADHSGNVYEISF